MARRNDGRKYSILTSLLDPCFGIPTDVTFEIMGYTHLQLDHSGEKEVKLGEVKGHKLIIGLFSPVFKSEFFGPAKDTKDTIPVRETTLEAFEKMLEFIYSKETDWSSLTVLEFYDVVNLAEKYDIPELMGHIKSQMDNIPLSMENVMEVADSAYDFNQFPDVSYSLLLRCAKFIKSKLRTPARLLEFAVDQSGSGQEATVLKLMALIKQSECSNCNSTPCKNGQEITNAEQLSPGCKMDVNNNDGHLYTVVAANQGSNTVKAIYCYAPTKQQSDYQILRNGLPTFCYKCD